MTKSDQNTHQIAPFKKKILGGSMPPDPPSKAHGFAMQISKYEKKNLAPPPKSWLRPWNYITL